MSGEKYQGMGYNPLRNTIKNSLWEEVHGDR